MKGSEITGNSECVGVGKLVGGVQCWLVLVVSESVLPGGGELKDSSDRLSNSPCILLFVK